MIIKNVPKLIHTPEDTDSFEFDKNGRFIYLHRDGCEDNLPPIFIVYDLMFNSYVKLNPGPSILSFRNGPSFSGEDGICTFEPIDVNQMLIVMPNEIVYPRESLFICLIHFDFKKKIYELLDKCVLNDCKKPQVVFDEENRKKFGLFCEAICTDGRLRDEEPLKVYTLQMFHINKSNKIIKDKMTEFDHDFYEVPCPGALHFYKENLWFIRSKTFPITIAKYDPNRVEIPPNPTDHYQPICYFEMKKERPKENFVNYIKEKKILKLKYAKDTLFLHLKEREFQTFNLDTFEWRKIESSVNFYDFYNDEQEKDWAKWTSFSISSYGKNNFVVTAGKSDEKSVYKVPLRSPLKLLNLTWIEALNNNFVNKFSSSEKSPYSRVF